MNNDLVLLRNILKLKNVGNWYNKLRNHISDLVPRYLFNFIRIKPMIDYLYCVVLKNKLLLFFILAHPPINFF